MDIKSLIIYTGVGVISAWLANCATKYNKKICLFLSIMCLALLSGLRAKDVGIDTTSYLIKFNYIANGKLSRVHGLEKTFTNICKILLDIWENNNFLLFIFAFVTHALIILRFWDFKDEISVGWAVVCYYCTFYFLSLNIMRQFCAIAIVFFGTRYLKKDKYIVFSIFVCMAGLFHTSALLGFGYLFFDLFRWPHFSRKRRIVLTAILLIGILLSSYALNAALKYEHYFETKKEFVEIGIYLIVKFIFFICSGIFITKGMDKGTRFLIQVYYFTGFILSTLGYFYLYMNRIGLYFMVYEGIYMGLLVKKSTDNSLFKILIALLFGTAFIYSFLQDGNGCVPYFFFWQ